MHISHRDNHPRSRTVPRYRHRFERGRGGLTTNGIHANLPLGLFNPRTASQFRCVTLYPCVSREYQKHCLRWALHFYVQGHSRI